jgi:hypothetical protein
MNYNIVRKLERGNAFFQYEEKSLFVDVFGIHFLDENYQEEDSLIDFFNGTDGIVFEEHYLLLRSPRIGFKVYDLKEKKGISFLQLKSEEMVGEDAYFIKDGKLYVVLGSNQNKMMDFILMDENENKDENSSRDIAVYDIWNFAIVDHYSVPIAMTRLYYVPFMDKTLAIDDKNQVYELRNGNPILLDHIHFKVEQILSNPVRNEIYLMSLTGIRTYDSQFREINKIDMIDSDYSIAKTEKKFGFDATIFGSVPQSDIVHYLGFVDSETFVCLKSFDVGSFFRVELIHIANGDVSYTQDFGFPLEAIRPIDAHRFLLKACGNLFIMEVRK